MCHLIFCRVSLRVFSKTKKLGHIFSHQHVHTHRDKGNLLKACTVRTSLPKGYSPRGWACNPWSPCSCPTTLWSAHPSLSLGFSNSGHISAEFLGFGNLSPGSNRRGTAGAPMRKRRGCPGWAQPVPACSHCGVQPSPQRCWCSLCGMCLKAGRAPQAVRVRNSPARSGAKGKQGRRCSRYRSRDSPVPLRSRGTLGDCSPSGIVSHQPILF